MQVSSSSFLLLVGVMLEQQRPSMKPIELAANATRTTMLAMTIMIVVVTSLVSSLASAPGILAIVLVCALAPIQDSAQVCLGLSP